MLNTDDFKFNDVLNLPEMSGPIDCPNPRVPYMIGVNQRTANVILFRPRCKMWTCPACGRTNAWAWAFRANYGAHKLYDDGHKLNFMTITSSNKITPAQSFWVAPRAWNKLQARIHRHVDHFQYYCIPEVQDRGHIHFHLITTGNLTKRWLKDNAAECGFGHQDDIKEVHDEGGVTQYAVKYLGKTLTRHELPKGTRRVRLSQQWPKVPLQEPPADWRFQLLPRKVSLEQAHIEWQQLGYAVALLGSKTSWQYLEIAERNV